jgi:UDP-N-acetylglucosamine 2-epimerase (non-hydrolysing)
MKMAPLYSELERAKYFNSVIVHTGQHYDYEMSQVFFEDLDLPEPHYFLGAGSGTHAEQTAKIMVEFEKVLLKETADLIVVFGDVNSTLACAITAKKLFVPVAHVEAGLRSFDETMPEEINRKLTDAISSFLFTPSRDGNENLTREGIDSSRIHLVGNIMIDSLDTILKKIDNLYEDKILQHYKLREGNYALVTLHRPHNVDNNDNLERILNYLNELSQRMPVIFPVHPRTKKNMKRFEVKLILDKEFHIVEPLRYKEFVALEKNARFVLTDSGGIQEETTYLNIPCLTLRPNTERPVTITEGTNELVNMSNIEDKSDLILSGNWKQGKTPELWDGKTAVRIVKKIIDSN